MRHPTEGVLRRLVDEPAGVADADRTHIAGCATCLTGVDRARTDAAATGAVLSAPPLSPADLDGAWHRLSSRADTQRAIVPDRGPRRLRTNLRSPLAAALGAVVILAGAGAAAAGDWLPIFRTQHVTAVPVNITELNQLPDLSAYGDVRLDGTTPPEQVAD